MKDNTEFYLNDRILKRIDSSVRLMKGDLINIEKVTYMVCGVTFSIDTDRSSIKPYLRQNVDLIKFES